MCGIGFNFKKKLKHRNYNSLQVVFRFHDVFHLCWISHLCCFSGAFHMKSTIQVLFTKSTCAFREKRKMSFRVITKYRSLDNERPTSWFIISQMVSRMLECLLNVWKFSPEWGGPGQCKCCSFLPTSCITLYLVLFLSDLRHGRRLNNFLPVRHLFNYAVYD